MVECQLPKLKVASSILVARSGTNRRLGSRCRFQRAKRTTKNIKILKTRVSESTRTERADAVAAEQLKDLHKPALFARQLLISPG